MKTRQDIDIKQVWEQFHKTHDDQSRNLLIEQYRYIVKYSAERLHSKLPDKVEVDDLISAGTFGLMDAIDAYDPSGKLEDVEKNELIAIAQAKVKEAIAKTEKTIKKLYTLPCPYSFCRIRA